MSKVIHDTTRTAGSLRRGELVNDDQTFDRIEIELATTYRNRVTITGRLLKSGNQVHRYWLTTDAVTVVSL